MDVMTMRFTVIFLIILFGLFVIPFGVLMYWVRKYNDQGRWWMLPIVILYIVLFFNYARELIPERWSLKPVETYHCEWRTTYEPKYPISE